MRRLFAFVALAAAVFVGPLSALAKPAAADTYSDEAAFVADINALRVSKGLNALVVDSGLVDIARGWAQTMANAGSIWHNPNLKDLVTANWQRLGENVGMGPGIQMLFDAFVASPGHYANLVDPSYTHVGVGVVYAGKTIYTSHQFMTLRGGGSSAPRATPPATTATTRPPAAPRSVAPPAPVVTTTTTVAPPPPPQPPPPPPAVPEMIRTSMEGLRRFDPRR